MVFSSPQLSSWRDWRLGWVQRWGTGLCMEVLLAVCTSVLHQEALVSSPVLSDLWPVICGHPAASPSCSRYTTGIYLQTALVGHISFSSFLKWNHLFFTHWGALLTHFFRIHTWMWSFTPQKPGVNSYPWSSLHGQSLEMLETFRKVPGTDMTLPIIVCWKERGRRGEGGRKVFWHSKSQRCSNVKASVGHSKWSNF